MVTAFIISVLPFSYRMLSTLTEGITIIGPSKLSRGLYLIYHVPRDKKPKITLYNQSGGVRKKQFYVILLPINHVVQALLIGFDLKANPIEILYNEFGKNGVNIFHAMPCQSRFLRLLEEGEYSDGN
jgi:hypothetical protein